jgi:hypothetical protein
LFPDRHRVLRIKTKIYGLAVPHDLLVLADEVIEQDRQLLDVALAGTS